MNLLSNILIESDVLTSEAIDELLTHCKTSTYEDLSVFDPEKTNTTGKTSWEVDKKVRDTQMIPFDDLVPKIEDLFKNIVSHIVNPFYDVKLRDSEFPQCLRYGVGGHYSPHIDGRSLWLSPTGDKIWRKSTDRDLTFVLYLNDDFEGGELIFPDLHIQVKPKPGLLVAFPSDQNYVHGVNPVKSGERFSIVTWARISGFLTKEEEDQELIKKYGVC